jgi:hypothetical protein
LKSPADPLIYAGIAAKASQREKLEHLARYVSRPPVAAERMSLTEGGYIRYTLKTPYRANSCELNLGDRQRNGAGQERFGAVARRPGDVAERTNNW